MFKREPKPERVALVDVRGKFTGQIVTKPEAHFREERHLDVHAWVTDGRGNILMQEELRASGTGPG